MSEQINLTVREEVKLDELRGELMRDIETAITVLGELRDRLEDDGPDAILSAGSTARILGAKIDENCSRFMTTAEGLKRLQQAARGEQDEMNDVEEEEDLDLDCNLNLVNAADALRFDLLRIPDDEE